MNRAIKWSMRYQCLTAEAFHDVSEAIGAALSASDAGEEAFVMIESSDEPPVMGFGDSRVVAIEERRDEAWRRSRESEPKIMYEVVASKPSDKDWSQPEAVVDRAATLDEARSVAVDVASIVGGSRVYVRETSR